jgi:hypothetical protein
MSVEQRLNGIELKSDLDYVNEQIKDMMVILKNGWCFVFNCTPNLNQWHYYRMVQQASLVIDNEGRMIKCRWMSVRKEFRFCYNNRKIELVEGECQSKKD